ncbi:MAG: hypothetical protein H7263_16445 [Candidatus Sericytochromatia bacterium]|nr:hypothetical protein [Candidatus Sericytochromatia bacterium]
MKKINLLVINSLILALTSCNNLPNQMLNNDDKSNNISKSDKNIIVDVEGLEPLTKPDNGFKILVDSDKILSGVQKLSDDKQDHDDNNEKPIIRIDDVILTDSGKSIVGKNSTDSIKPNYNSKNINLTLNGLFKTNPKLEMKNMAWTYEAGLIQESFLNNKPKLRVLIDNVILGSVLSTSQTSINLRWDSKFVGDFYLKGLHKLTFIAGNYFSDVLINIGTPEIPDNINLTPSIDNVTIINDKKGLPINLKLTGKNFMIYPKFSYSTIDNQGFGFGNYTSVSSDGIFETIIAIPDPKLFAKTTSHTVSYSSPFGYIYKLF